MNNQKIISLMFSLIVFANNSFPQAKVVTNVSGKTFDILVATKPLNYKDHIKGDFVQRDYYEFTDPSNPGSYKLPSQTYVLAIPFGSYPTFSIISKTEKNFRRIFPSVNPVLLSENDSTLTEKEISPTVIQKKLNKKSMIKVVGEDWYRNFYCVVIRIDRVNFNIEKSEITESSNIKIKVNLNFPFNVDPNSPIKLISPFDRELKKIIYNQEIAEQFRTEPNRIFDDSTG